MEKFIRGLAVASIFTLFAAPALAQDVTGTWRANLEAEQGPVELVFTFRQDAEEITGSLSAGGADSNITDGQISGNELTFNVPWAGMGDGPPTVIAYEATVDGDEMAIVSTLTFAPGMDPLVTEFTAHRAQ